MKKTTCILLIFVFLIGCWSCSGDSGSPAEPASGKTGSTDLGDSPGEPSAANPDGGATKIDGTWRLAKLGDTPIPPMAANLVYTFRNGRATYKKDGKPEGDGFCFELRGDLLFITGAKEEALLDTGENLHHFTVKLEDGSMSWSMASPMSPTGHQVMYVFEKK